LKRRYAEPARLTRGAPSRWFDNPPASEGSKVIITDTDHYAPGKGDALWAWKTFLRGHHPILMNFGIIAGVNPPDPSSRGPGVPPYEAFEAARYAMGETLRFAQRTNLIGMEPRDDLSSTGYVLANPGQEYLVLQPAEATDPYTVMLEGGTYAVEWFSVNGRQSKAGDKVIVPHDQCVSFTAPFAQAGPTVLYLKQVG